MAPAGENLRSAASTLRTEETELLLLFHLSALRTAHLGSQNPQAAGPAPQLVRSQRPAGLPAAPSQATARRPTSQLLQRAYVCVVLPCTLLRRIEREILRAACHAHAARPRRF